ncbi:MULTISPECIES: cell division protein SepF [unclassified Streptomyces]|uniref:cell division protein SepF n=1 Tax=unclassified Streptomyces TaxID=2593676 RepID=UPI002DDA8EBD|nr:MULTISPECIES: cell division protein SepF [unclassified Streptomyces]WSA95757.1 cell division protein SepF [Streptomyces sp. NBC_01795]WSB80177.1 cell division protein SepF [Streptomyces sp. NBC_01775]WSS11615.1 cell division protein SepF [Streptomyces sp. NBC_01186]WSS40330.1 cell division protein SepF [Streptomyces sp. NBC_01187]
MGSVRKASAWLGLVDDSEMRYYDYADGPEDGPSEGPEPSDAARESWVTDPRVRVTAETAQDQGTKIATVTPDCFRDARGIGELFRDGVPVIVNLTAMESADAKRVVDFAAGLTFGLRGSIERVATRVFLLTPNDYKIVSNEDRRDPGGFFNQS